MKVTLLTTLFHDTIALITILNPVAAAGILVSMLEPATPETVRRSALRATLTVTVASLITLYAGQYVFEFFGINIMSIKVIGGVILMLIAVNMAYGQSTKAQHTPEEREEALEKEDISVIPVGIPILFGPGMIATLVVLDHTNARLYSPPGGYLLLTLAILLAMIVVYGVLRNAAAIDRMLGVTGMKILTRVMGLVVGAIAAQFLVSGIKGLWG